MQRNRYLLIGGAVLAVILLVSVGIWIGKSSHKTVVVRQAQSDSGGDENTASTGLRVNGSATDLGQLGSNNQIGLGGSSTSGSSANTPSPDQFKDYDKYKDNQGALFGEISVGSGTELTAQKKATIYYRGWLTDGTLFDQNINSQPLQFTLGAGQVVRGMEEGVYGMKAGGKRLVIIPPAVGYGATGQGPVPANAVMVFEVQLVRVD